MEVLNQTLARIDEFEWIHGTTPLSTLEGPFLSVALYFFLVYFLQYQMKDRKAFNLHYLVIFHNLFLSTLSLFYVVFIAIEISSQYSVGGLEALFCDADERWSRGRYYFLLYLFYLSKYYELFDSIFLALKKKPLIFLHVYHHPATLLLCYLCLDWRVTPQWFCTAANGLVHTFMYFYYVLALLKINVWWKKYITGLQIFQFIADISANSFWAYFTIKTGRICSGGWGGFWAGQIVIFSYLILFIRFFMGTYKKKIE